MSEFQQYLDAAGPAGTAVQVAEASQAALHDGFVAAVGDSALIAVSGAEAAAFLHGQLTNDVLHLAETAVPGFGNARLAGYCTPKGRLLATLLIWQDGETIWLQVPAELAPALQKRLQMYVLRAKVKLQAVAGVAGFEAQQVMLGLGGATAGTALQQWFAALPPQPYLSASSPAGTLIRLADAFGAPRYQWLCSEASARAAWPVLTSRLAAVRAADWQLAAIRAGVPQLSLATQEKFVPQMINFELLGGVNFKKGCYPGQEIVARSQYLGTQKRRMLRARVAADTVAAGAELFSSADPGQPCGMVVNSVAVQDERGRASECLTEIKLSLIGPASVHLGSADGPPLQWLELPYALDADAA